MFISQAIYEVDVTAQHKMIAKMQETMKETMNVKGLISVDCWFKESKESVVEYVFVTKWESKPDFITWLTREEHVEGHKEMSNQKKHGQAEEIKIKKIVRQYEVVDLLSL
ncbi:antibiotic biosynthesis monooxygenase [Cohnella sp.]|uniref:antibiotic biosynthesis monooxygenase family protein n=1 Tax=Cohnella sp. TaxID=1883426 RepID=UPI003561DFB3